VKDFHYLFVVPLLASMTDCFKKQYCYMYSFWNNQRTCTRNQGVIESIKKKKKKENKTVRKAALSIV